MNYHGKLYGKLWNKYFDTDHTTDEWDAMVKRIAQLEAENHALHQPLVSASLLPDMEIEEAEVLSMQCDYACFAVETNKNEINTADASAFFLEGYLEAQRRLKSNDQ